MTPKKTDLPDVEGTADPPLHAVVIVKTTDDEGNIGTDVVLNGNVTALEAATLIKLGSIAWDRKLGFS